MISTAEICEPPSSSENKSTRADEDFLASDTILDSLYFDGMERYHDRPLDNHPGTFDWLFDEHSERLLCNRCSKLNDWYDSQVCECHRLKEYATRLRNWLETSEEIFWIHGKAGSGKSTFMKFLLENDQTQRCLRKWAGKEVLTAAFFFWKAGSDKLEKSQEGLLRALLYQILQQHPELVSSTFPVRWKCLERSRRAKPWTRKELLDGFRLVLREVSIESRFCFLIDGLDELEGDHNELIAALDALNISSAVKICVSSRPWNIFRTAYMKNADTQFALHELTSQDIDVYITDTLNAPRRGPVNWQRSELATFRQDIRQRAKGVFLWVTLAVKNLRRGIDEGDSVGMLQKRFKAYPTELQDFYQHIFDSIEPIYHVYTACLILMMLHDSLLPSLLEIAFSEEDVERKGSVPYQWTPKTLSEMQRLESYAITCVNKWCRDFAALFDRFAVRGDLWERRDNFVTFSHRTTYEFFRVKAEQDILLDLAGSHFCEESTAWSLRLRVLSCAPGLTEFGSLVLDVFDNDLKYPRISSKDALISALSYSDALGNTISGIDQHLFDVQKYFTRSTDLCRDISIRLIESGMDVNKPIERPGPCHYSIWQVFVFWMYCEADLGYFEKPSDLVVAVFCSFLKQWADPWAVVAGSHRDYSMTDVENPVPLVTPLMSIAGILQRLKSSVSEKPEFDDGRILMVEDMERLLTTAKAKTTSTSG